MPNNVINEVTLHGVNLAQSSSIILNKEGGVDFSKLLPLPLNFWPGSVSSLHENAFPGTHLDAARQIWGTKWNAYGDKMSATEINGATVLVFETAWSPPRGWVVALFNHFKCDITHLWLDEGDTKSWREMYDFSALSVIFGEAFKQEAISEEGRDHKRLHKLLWGVESFADEKERT